jgi:hypothetical protein
MALIFADRQSWTIRADKAGGVAPRDESVHVSLMAPHAVCPTGPILAFSAPCFLCYNAHP